MMKLNKDIQGKLCCPVCRSKLDLEDKSLKCTGLQCRNSYPIIDGVPILLNESSSIFQIENIALSDKPPFSLTAKVRQLIENVLPELDINLGTKENFEAFSDLLLKVNDNPKVLVLGGRIMGKGMEGLLSNPSILFIETDVSFGPRTDLICDAHDIPFENSTFDGVIIQAVLEHVADPYGCVEEIFRVLKEDGLVYAETPFMQQVHMGRYDFTRFTHLGHRRLFRKFEEISSGAVGGPGLALALSFRYFFLSFLTSRAGRFFVHVFSSLLFFWLKYFDYYLIRKPCTLDAATGFYFTGRKSDHIISDRELVEQYKGCFH